MEFFFNSDSTSVDIRINPIEMSKIQRLTSTLEIILKVYNFSERSRIRKYLLSWELHSDLPKFEVEFQRNAVTFCGLRATHSPRCQFSVNCNLTSWTQHNTTFNETNWNIPHLCIRHIQLVRPYFQIPKMKAHALSPINYASNFKCITICSSTPV
jgi:hypothetical protein